MAQLGTEGGGGATGYAPGETVPAGTPGLAGAGSPGVKNPLPTNTWYGSGLENALAANGGIWLFRLADGSAVLAMPGHYPAAGELSTAFGTYVGSVSNSTQSLEGNLTTAINDLELVGLWETGQGSGVSSTADAASLLLKDLKDQGGAVHKTSTTGANALEGIPGANAFGSAVSSGLSSLSFLGSLSFWKGIGLCLAGAGILFVAVMELRKL